MILDVPFLLSVIDVFLIFVAYVLVAGSLPMSDLSVAFPSGQSAFTSQISGALPSAGATGDIPLHKLSTASLPATMPSVTPKNSTCSQYDATSPAGRGSDSTPATSRKRKPVSNEEKVGSSAKVNAI